MTETPAQIAARYGAVSPEGLTIKRVRMGISGVWDEYGNARKYTLNPRTRAIRKAVLDAMSRGLTSVSEIADKYGISEHSVIHWMQRTEQERKSEQIYEEVTQ